MIDKFHRQKIEERARQIYEYRVKNGISGCAVDDWLKAESGLVDRRQIKVCPICDYQLIARDGNKIICLRCNWKIEAKRKLDGSLADYSELRKNWK